RGACNGERSHSRTRLAPGRAVEGHPSREVRGEIFEPVRLTRGHERERGRSGRAAGSTVEERASPPGHQIHPLAVVRLLRGALPGRVELHLERAVREDWHGQIALWRRAIR